MLAKHFATEPMFLPVLTAPFSQTFSIWVPGRVESVSDLEKETGSGHDLPLSIVGAKGE